MLEPNIRSLLLDSLRPPTGYRLDWAVGTTYTLDLVALLAAPVAFAFSDWQDREGRPLCDPLALLKAVRQYADRMLLFCQAGKIVVPKSYQMLLASLEGTIVEAVAPQGGSFHPKVWFLRYENSDQEVLYRFLCLSRNMTFDRAWDTMLCLEGPLTDRANAYASSHPLGQFVDALLGMSVRKCSKEWKSRLAQLAYEIRRVDFDVPEPFEEMSFWPIGIDPTQVWPFGEPAQRTLVISPFVSDSLLAELNSGSKAMELISRGEQLELLSSGTLEGMQSVWVLDNSAEPEPSEIEDADADGTGAALEMADSDVGTALQAIEDIPLVGLHAKAFILDQGWKASVFTGSANATHAAFHGNVEFLTELRGKKSVCGVQAVLGKRHQGTDKKQVSGIIDLLQPFVPRDGAAAEDAAAREFDKLVGNISRQIATALPVATCGPGSEPETYSITLTPTKKLRIRDTHEFKLSVRPASLNSVNARPVDFAAGDWARFDAISILGLTSFFVFEVSVEEAKLTRGFVLNIPLVNEPAGRRDATLRYLLSDADRVLRFMLLLLSDADAHDFATLFGDGENGSETHVFGQSLSGATLFESLLRSLDRQPEQLDQVAEMIADLQRTEEGRNLLPKSLSEIWDPVWSVRQQLLEARRVNRTS